MCQFSFPFLCAELYSMWFLVFSSNIHAMQRCFYFFILENQEKYWKIYWKILELIVEILMATLGMLFPILIDSSFVKVNVNLNPLQPSVTIWRNQSMNLLCKSVNWFLHNSNTGLSWENEI